MVKKITLAIILSLPFLNDACAQTLNTWIGITASWGTATNWSLGHVPTTVEIALFDGSSTVNCNMDVGSYGVQTTNYLGGLWMKAAYTGTVSHTVSGPWFIGNGASVGTGWPIRIEGGTLMCSSSGQRVVFCSSLILNGGIINGSASDFRTFGDSVMVQSGTIILTNFLWRMFPQHSSVNNAVFSYTGGTISHTGAGEFRIFSPTTNSRLTDVQGLDLNLYDFAIFANSTSNPSRVRFNGQNINVANSVTSIGSNNVTLNLDATAATTINVTQHLTVLGGGGSQMVNLNSPITIKVGGNITASGTFSTTASLGNGQIEVNGTGSQTINSSAWALPSLRINKASGLLIMGSNNAVNNTLEMVTSTLTDLAGYTLTLGTSAASPGTLSRTNGWMYGGTFKRWLGTTAIAVTSSAALFPVGSSSDYCPFRLGYAANLTTGGTVSVNFTYVPGTSPAGWIDFSWSSNTVSYVTNSTWNVTQSPSLTPAANSYILRYGGGTTSFGTNSLNDIAAEHSVGSIGTYTTSTNNEVSYEVNRTTVNDFLSGYNFKIGTRDEVGSSLPITLVDFNATLQEKRVKLTWQTASELMNKWFVVERSRDGIDYAAIDTIAGAGNSQLFLAYIAYDESPQQGINYYRLKQIDQNGSFTFSDIATISLDIGAETFYPNPAQTEGYIAVHVSEETELTIEILTTDGKTVQMQKRVVQEGSSNVMIDVRELPASIFILKIFSQNGIINLVSKFSKS